MRLLVLGLLPFFATHAVSATEIDWTNEPLRTGLSAQTAEALNFNRMITWGDLRRRYAKEGNVLLRTMSGVGRLGALEIRAAAGFAAIRVGTRLDPALGNLEELGLSVRTVRALEKHGVWNRRELLELYRAKGFKAFVMIHGIARQSREEIFAYLNGAAARCELDLLANASSAS